MRLLLLTLPFQLCGHGARLQDNWCNHPHTGCGARVRGARMETFLGDHIGVVVPQVLPLHNTAKGTKLRARARDSTIKCHEAMSRLSPHNPLYPTPIADKLDLLTCLMQAPSNFIRLPLTHPLPLLGTNKATVNYDPQHVPIVASRLVDVGTPPPPRPSGVGHRATVYANPSLEAHPAPVTIPYPPTTCPTWRP